MQKYLIETYGCQMNYSDTERIENYLESLGFEKTGQTECADIIIFNTCSIRQKAEDRVFGRMREIKKLARKKPDLIVIITGCMIRKTSTKNSEDRDKLFNKMKLVNICLRIEDLPALAKMIREVRPRKTINEIEEESLINYFKIPATHSQTARAQGFIPISTGCDKFCTYCIVPYSRGREKSRSVEDILKEAKELAQNGYKEIILIGQTVNSYGLSAYDKINKNFSNIPQNKEPFVFLLEELDKLSNLGLKRIRFTSPHPKDMSDQLIRAMAELETLMPYLHLPVQSGDNQILKRMNRPYTIERYKEIVQKLRSAIPDIAISTDIIVGFCGETKEEFKNTHKLFKDLEFDHAYLAQYSERTGTFASKNLKDDISPKVKQERWHELNDLLKKFSRKKLKKFIGKTVNVLVEKYENGICEGRSEHFKTVSFKGDKSLLGQIIPVKIKESKEWILIGEKE